MVNIWLLYVIVVILWFMMVYDGNFCDGVSIVMGVPKNSWYIYWKIPSRNGCMAEGTPISGNNPNGHPATNKRTGAGF